MFFVRNLHCADNQHITERTLQKHGVSLLPPNTKIDIFFITRKYAKTKFFRKKSQF